MLYLLHKTKVLVFFYFPKIPLFRILYKILNDFALHKIYNRASQICKIFA